MEYYTAIKRNKTVPFVTEQMDLEGIMLSERPKQTNKNEADSWTERTSGCQSGGLGDWVKR